MLINADLAPTDSNPHSWLPLIGDPTGAADPRILYGVLRPVYRGRINSAAEFARAKINVKPTPGDHPWEVTAARVEVLLPLAADDRFADPRTLMEAVDAERPADKPVLLTYVTITFATDRRHHQYELVRAYAQEMLVAEHGVGVVLIQHAPTARPACSPRISTCSSPGKSPRWGCRASSLRYVAITAVN
jgi:hypothetical protein